VDITSRNEEKIKLKEKLNLQKINNKETKVVITKIRKAFYM
jgi:hypothetical protein